MTESHAEHTDGCDLDFTADVTRDADLPPASGGVQRALESRESAAPDDADGCELDFATAVLTHDAELPVTTGGVA